jgi:hypothetical protein
VAEGVSCANNEGSARLMRAAAERGGEAFGARGWTEEEHELLRQHNARSGLAKTLVLGYHGPLWGQEKSPCSALPRIGKWPGARGGA